MPFLEWTPELSVGVTDIDEQHAQLLKLTNDLHDQIDQHAAAVDASAVLEQVLDYTRYHFHFEEQLMERSGYPGLAEHRKKHRALFLETEIYLERANFGSTTVAQQTMSFLQNWIVKHIMQSDKAYSQCAVTSLAAAPLESIG